MDFQLIFIGISLNFNWISEQFLLEFHWYFHFHIIEISNGFTIDTTGIQLVSIGISFKIQLDLQWISIGIQLKFQLVLHYNFNWIAKGIHWCFIEISIGIHWNDCWIFIGFSLLFLLNYKYPFEFPISYFQFPIKFLIEF